MASAPAVAEAASAAVIAAEKPQATHSAVASAATPRASMWRSRAKASRRSFPSWRHHQHQWQQQIQQQQQGAQTNRQERRQGMQEKGQQHQIQDQKVMMKAAVTSRGYRQRCLLQQSCSASLTGRRKCCLSVAAASVPFSRSLRSRRNSSKKTLQHGHVHLLGNRTCHML